MAENKCDCGAPLVDTVCLPCNRPTMLCVCGPYPGDEAYAAAVAEAQSAGEPLSVALANVSADTEDHAVIVNEVVPPPDQGVNVDPDPEVATPEEIAVINDQDEPTE